MIAYDYKTLVNNNLCDRRIKKGGCFDGAAGGFWGELNGVGQAYSFTAEYYKTFRKSSRGRVKLLSLKVTVSQTGMSAVNDGFEFMEAYKICKKVEEELSKYSFKPALVELWSDHPDVPYFVPKGRESLCERFMSIAEWEERT